VGAAREEEVGPTAEATDDEWAQALPAVLGGA